MLNGITNEPPKRQFVWAILNQGILSLGALGVIAVLSRFLDETVFGETRYIVAILTLFAFFSLPGAGSVVTQKVSVLGRKGVEHILMMQLRWGLGAFVGSLFFFAYYLHARQIDLAYGFLIGGMFAPVANLYQMPGLIFAGLKQFQKKLIVDGAVLASVMIAGRLGALYSNSVVGSLSAYYGVQSCITVGLLWYVLRHVSFGDKTQPLAAEHAEHLNAENFDAKDFKHSKQLSLLYAPFALLPSIEKALVFIVLGPASLAIFTIAVLPIEHIKTAFRNFLQFVALPYMDKGMPAGKIVVRWMSISCLLVGLGFLGLLFFVWFIIPVVFPDYVASIHYSLILTLAMIPLPFQVLSTSLIAARKIKGLSMYVVGNVVISIAALVMLAPLYGLYGVVMAKVLSEFLSAFGLAMIYFFAI